LIPVAFVLAAHCRGSRVPGRPTTLYSLIRSRQSDKIS
jgi:hypothetical protein